MKNFHDLPLLKSNPEFGLHIEDGIPKNVDLKNYKGVRNISEVLSYSELASNISEICDVAKKMSYSNVRVIRLSKENGATRAMTPGEFECLSEFGIYLFAISDANSKAPNYCDVLKTEFVRLVAYTESGVGSLWKKFVTYRSAIIHSGLSYTLPTWLIPHSSNLLAFGEDDAWGLGIPATLEQMLNFSDAVLMLCDSWGWTQASIDRMQSWLYKNKDSFETIDELVEKFSKELKSQGPFLETKNCA